MMPARILRLCLPTLVVLVVGVVAGWLPARAAGSDAAVRADSAMRIVDELSWEIEDLSTLAPSLDSLQAETARFESAIPAEPQLAEFILALERLADEHGVQVVDVVPTSVLGSFDDAATPPGTSSVVVAVALTGSFSATVDFLDGLSGLSRLVVAEAIAVGFDEMAAALAIDLELRVFTTEELVEFTDEFLDVEDDEFDEEPVE